MPSPLRKVLSCSLSCWSLDLRLALALATSSSSSSSGINAQAERGAATEDS